MNAAGPILITVGLFFIIKNLVGKAIDKAPDVAEDLFRNVVSKTPLGAVGIVRSSTAEKASSWILNCKWLTHAYWEKVTSPDNHVLELYNLDLMTDAEADEIARMIINSNYRIFSNDVLDRLANIGLTPIAGELDKPANVLDAFSGIKNRAQAVQVTYWYYSRTGDSDGHGGKDLNKGVQWLPDNYIIELARYLKELPSGVTSKTTGVTLADLPNF